MFTQGMTAVEMAAKVGCSTTPIKKELKRLGLRRPAKRRPGKGVGPDNPSWKGGRRIRIDGYVAVWTPKGERLEHQVVMEEHLERPVFTGEVIHHKDRNKQNNDIGNLELTTQSAHAREHAAEMQRARYAR